MGILARAFLLPGCVFAGADHAPTLEGQYVLKDIILVAAGIVIAAGSFRGGRLVRGDLAPGSRPAVGAPLDPGQQLQVVLHGLGNETLVKALCTRHQIPEAEFYRWRETSLAGAAAALASSAAADDA